jgi:hypothetical protein
MPFRPLSDARSLRRLDKAELLDPGKRLRCTFYFLSVLSEMSPSCVVLTVYCSKTRKSTFDLKLITDGISYFITRRVIPVRFDRLHYVMLSTRPVLDFVIPTTLKALEKVGGQEPNSVVVHSDHSVDAVQDALREHGFSLEGMPKVPLGGLFTFGCFRRWVEDRIRVGARLYGHPSRSALVDPAAAAAGADGSDAKPAVAAAAAAALNGDDEDPEEAAARKRRDVYAGYARRKRARKRIEAKVLQSEVSRLERQRDELENVGHDLESRLDRAGRLVAAHLEAGQHQQPQSKAHKSSAGQTAGMRLSAAEDDRVLGMQQSLPPQRTRSSSNGSGGGGGMQHRLFPPLSSIAGLQGGWYQGSAASPYPQETGYPLAYQGSPPLFSQQHGRMMMMAASSAAGAPPPPSSFPHGSRPIIFLDAAAAAYNPMYVLGNPVLSSSAYMGGAPAAGFLGGWPWSSGPSPLSHDPVSSTPSSSSSSFGNAAKGAPVPPPPPSPS